MSGQYVGYLNSSRIYADQLSNPDLNPNGICRITLNAAVPSIGSGSGESASDLYREIFSNSNKLGPCRSVNDNEHEYLIQSGFTKTIYCCVGDDIQFGGSNNWELSIDRAVNKYIDRGLSKAGKFGDLVKDAFGLASGAVGVKVQTLAQTIKFWMGSSDPGPFNLRFNMLATAPDTDIRKELLALYASVFPVQAGRNEDTGRSNSGSILGNILSIFGKEISDIVSSSVLIAPLGYNPVDAYLSSIRNMSGTLPGSGLIDVKIGRWLHLPNMIAKDFNADISRVTTRLGFPLYAKCNLLIEPCRAWRLNDVKEAIFSSESGIQNSKSKNIDSISKYRLGETP